ncbi:MAG TPA: hypothetical protein VND64_16285 [Pirellulales bacterium]|nr:hypothetical protein [Pirellulales bacterium]
MTIILGAEASDPNSAHACDHAVIELTPELAAKILARFAAVQRADSSAHELHFWDCEVSFFQRTEDDGLGNRVPIDSSEYMAFDDAVVIGDDALIWTECEHMVVASNGDEPEVYWRANSKRSPVRMRTCALPRSFLIDATRGGAGTPATSTP